MNKGLDALDTMICWMHPEEVGNFKEIFNTIKQELEHLDKLEKENQKLEKFIEWLKDDEGNLYIKPEMLDKLKELGLYKEVQDNDK